MFHALVLAASIYTVQSGDTLSGIAASNGVSLSTLEADNPQIGDPNLIYVGESVHLSGGSSYTASPATSSDSSDSSSSGSSGYSSGSSSSSSSSGTSSSYSSGGSSSGYHIPGMSDSMASCIAFRESTNGQASSNVFQIMPSSGYSVAGMSLAQQEQVAGQIYANQGGSAWASDGCPGT